MAVISDKASSFHRQLFDVQRKLSKPGIWGGHSQLASRFDCDAKWVKCGCPLAIVRELHTDIEHEGSLQQQQDPSISFEYVFVFLGRISKGRRYWTDPLPCLLRWGRCGFIEGVSVLCRPWYGNQISLLCFWICGNATLLMKMGFDIRRIYIRAA